MHSAAYATTIECSAMIADRYRLRRRIATGGMAEVYEADDTRLGRRVAIKFPKPERLGDARFLARFEREATAIAALECEHCVAILDVNLDPERPFIVMEYIRGESLRELIDREGWLPVPRAASIVQQAAVGLQAVHAAGIIHRDLKPENVMITRVPYVGDWVKVLDFGIARLEASPALVTTTGTIVGTPYYMAPEQARGDSDLDARVDVYALSALLFELLTGERAHAGRSYNEVMYRIMTQHTPSLTSLRPDLPLGLCTLVEKGMEKDRDLRFESSSELAIALEPYARRTQVDEVDTCTRTVVSQLGEVLPMTRHGRAGYIAASLVACAGFGLGFWTGRDTNQPEARVSPALPASPAASPELPGATTDRGVPPSVEPRAPSSASPEGSPGRSATDATGAPPTRGSRTTTNAPVARVKQVGKPRVGAERNGATRSHQGSPTAPGENTALGFAAAAPDGFDPNPYND